MIEADDIISGIGVTSITFKNGNIRYKMKNEKKGSRQVIFDPKHIRNTPMRNVVQCIRYLRQELNGIPISTCSFQLVCALVAKYLGTSKKDYILFHSAYSTTKKYPQRVYDLAHTVFFLAMELRF